MLQTWLQYEKVAGAQLGTLALGQAQTNSALNSLNGNWTVRMMMAHAAVRLHYDQNNPEILILHEGLGTATRFLLQGGCAPEPLNLLVDVGPDHCICKLWKACEGIAILVGVARFFMFGHVSGMHSFALRLRG